MRNKLETQNRAQTDYPKIFEKMHSCIYRNAYKKYNHVSIHTFVRRRKHADLPTILFRSIAKQTEKVHLFNLKNPIKKDFGRMNILINKYLIIRKMTRHLYISSFFDRNRIKKNMSRSITQ